MPSPNPNSFDFFNPVGEILPFTKGTIGTNNFDFFNPVSEIFQAIIQNDSLAQGSAINSPPKRRIFLID